MKIGVLYLQSDQIDCSLTALRGDSWDAYGLILKYLCVRIILNNLPCSFTEETKLQFAPINLHLQRMWVHNDTLSKTGFHDVVTVGAFAAHSHKSNRSGGLLR